MAFSPALEVLLLEPLAEVLSAHNKRIGSAVLNQRIGKGRAVSLSYDPVETSIILRHGWSDYDMPPWSGYGQIRSKFRHNCKKTQ